MMGLGQEPPVGHRAALLPLLPHGKLWSEPAGGVWLETGAAGRPQAARPSIEQL